MEKRCCPEAGHFKQLNDIQLRNVKKRRVKQVIVLPDDYIVEQIVAKRQRQNSTEYLINWAGYRPEEATWKPAAHIPAWLLEDFEKPCQDEALIYDCRERLSLTFERGLKVRLVADFNIEMKHAVFRVLLPMIKPALSSSWQEITKRRLSQSRISASAGANRIQNRAETKDRVSHSCTAQSGKIADLLQ